MQRKDLDGLLAVNETVLRANLLKGPRLTPTGKISHAKTRVYTQRYRKEWELMLDFKGWLTSVPLQPTRAYCTYCKKDLHAHRLSLLKHTCTMKHQRSALMHQNEMNALKAKQEMSKVEASMGEHDENEGHMVISGKEGDEDNDDDIEYVVERLDVDDEEIEEIQRKHKEEQVTEEEEEEEEMLRPSEDEDIKPSIQSIKEERCRDTLAEAMAHVQGEYLEETDDQMNVELVEMVVESTQANQDLIPEERNDHTDMVVEEEEEEEEEDDRLEQHEISLGKKESDDHEKSFEDVESSEQETNIYQSVGKTNTSFKVNPVNQQQGLPISMTSLSNKTITLTSVGKTLTLAGGKLTPGAQYVLGKMKGKMPTLVMANRKPITVVNLADVSPKAAPVKIVQQPVTTGPIQQSSKKHYYTERTLQRPRRPDQVELHGRALQDPLRRRQVFHSEENRNDVPVHRNSLRRKEPDQSLPHARLIESLRLHDISWFGLVSFRSWPNRNSYPTFIIVKVNFINLPCLSLERKDQHKLISMPRIVDTLCIVQILH
ncbi:probable serine/threonine-protein kinase kinX isoform X1 [Orussus abietinus]|uniref:probable serine/threonine-protein kinase kinX isoform X1 n=1 Tax=Orussus abietinus TaxID=222816 RepID=UPI0006257B40|nr:probable serine/threonine-protein kinase kinX isoform X1 [Orussus abietinus]